VYPVVNVISRLLLALPLWALLAGPAPTPPPTLTLRDGRVFQLREAPRTEGDRVVFTTTEGKSYSLPSSDVQSFVPVPPTPTRPPRTYNPQDSRDLGAIARQQRAETGKTTDLSGAAPTPRPTRPPKTRTKSAPPPSSKKTPHAAHTARTPTPVPH
jgi:hypothetical protein